MRSCKVTSRAQTERSDNNVNFVSTEPLDIKNRQQTSRLLSHLLKVFWLTSRASQYGSGNLIPCLIASILSIVFWGSVECGMQHSEHSAHFLVSSVTSSMRFHCTVIKPWVMSSSEVGRLGILGGFLLFSLTSAYLQIYFLLQTEIST